MKGDIVLFSNDIFSKTKWRKAKYQGKEIENWIISEDGKLFNTKTGEFRNGHDNVRNKDKHLRVSLNNRQYYVSRIVAETFLENPNPSKNTIDRHLDDEPHHNNYRNLMWGTPRENTWDAIRNEKIIYDENRKYARGDLHGNRVLNSRKVEEIIQLLLKKVPLKEIAQIYGVDIDVIRHIYKGTSWKCLTENYLPFPEQKLRKPMNPKIKKKIRKYIKDHPNAKTREITINLGIEKTGSIKAFIGKERKKIKNR